MTDDQILMAAILADPTDDAPRLAYSDWCEEHGQVERAELIRVQIELSKLTDQEGIDLLPECKVCSARPNADGERHHGKGCYVLDENGGGDDYFELNDRQRLQFREKELLNTYNVFALTVARLISVDVYMKTKWRRGFPYFLQVSWESWLKNWQKFREMIPLEEVEFTVIDYSTHINLRIYGMPGSTWKARILDKQYSVDVDDYRNYAGDFKTNKVCVDLISQVPEWKSIKFNIVNIQRPHPFQTHSGD